MFPVSSNEIGNSEYFFNLSNVIIFASGRLQSDRGTHYLYYNHTRFSGVGDNIFFSLNGIYLYMRNLRVFLRNRRRQRLIINYFLVTWVELLKRKIKTHWQQCPEFSKLFRTRYIRNLFESGGYRKLWSQAPYFQQWILALLEANKGRRLLQSKKIK